MGTSEKQYIMRDSDVGGDEIMEFSYGDQRRHGWEVHWLIPEGMELSETRLRWTLTPLEASHGLDNGWENMLGLTGESLFLEIRMICLPDLCK